MICTSMWRPRSTYVSISSVSSPKAAAASRRAAAIASASSAARRTILIPLPPPPAAAFTSTGKIISAAGVSRSYAGHHRDPRPDSDRAGRVLAAHLLHHHRGRADQDQAGVLDRPREGGPLGQEAVAGMDRGRAGGQSGGDDALDVEVVGHPDRLIGRPDMGGGRVGVTEDRHATDAEPPTGAQHPDGDLAAVGDQHRGDHAGSLDLDAGGCTRRLHDHIRKTP